MTIARSAPRLRVLMAAMLALGTIWLAQLAAPELARACTCRIIANPDIARAAENPEYVVFIGTVTSIDRPMVGQNSDPLGDMRVERVFKGALPAVARVRDGGRGDCSMPLTIGMQMLWVAPYRNEVLSPGMCGLNTETATPEGRALTAAAEIAFGPGAFLVPPPDGPAIERVPTASAEAALPLVLGAALAGVVALFGGVLLFARWSRSR